jgi:peptidoglycan/xylan/chitin deacetylase (PgdA/CDA1 family)
MLIVTYHAIDARRSPVCTSPEDLRNDLFGLRNAGFAFASMDRCKEWLTNGTSSPTPSIVLTFDDGYASVVREAVPILREFAATATVFVIADRVGRSNDWPGQWPSVPRMPLADLAEIRAMTAAGLTIGAHSCTHRPLTAVPDEELQREIIGSGERLEDMIEQPVRHFAYPYGRRTGREVTLAATRYETASAATPRIVQAGVSAHDLPRIDAHDLRVALRLGIVRSPALPSYLTVRRGLRRVRRLMEGTR